MAAGNELSYLDTTSPSPIAGLVGGVGIVFDRQPEENGLVLAGTDFDEAITCDGVSHYAMRWLKRLKSYTERSVSGSGYHVISKARPLQRGVNHQQDWVRACKGGAPAVSQFPVAAKYIEWLALGPIALRVPGKLLWDSKNMRFTNSEQANKLLKPYTRKGWELKI